MAGADELARLVGQLRRVSSPLERMKVLARGWRTLRRLSSGERRALAQQVGFDGAEELIEKLAVRKAGVSPGSVQRVLDRVRGADPGEIRTALQGLRDPERRKDWLERGIDTAAGVLAGQVAEEAPEENEAEPPAEAEPVRRPAEKRPRKRSIPVESAGAAAATTAAAAVATPRKIPREEPSAPVPEAPAPEPPVSRVEKPAERPPETPRAAAAPTPVVETPPARAAPKPAPAAPAGVPLYDRLEREDKLIRRFRILREGVDEARGLNVRQLRDLLGLFPSGWGQRRALDALLEHGVPDSLNKAVFLIEHLQSEAERRWCVSTLLHEWTLTDDEKQTLVERHGMFRVAPPAR